MLENQIGYKTDQPDNELSKHEIKSLVFSFFDDFVSLRVDAVLSKDNAWDEKTYDEGNIEDECKQLCDSCSFFS